MESMVKMNTQVQKTTTKKEAASRDLQVVHTTIVLNFSLEPDKAGDVYKSLGLGYAERVIELIVKEAFKVASTRYTAEELISKREMLKNEVREYLKTQESHGAIRHHGGRAFDHRFRVLAGIQQGH